MKLSKFLTGAALVAAATSANAGLLSVAGGADYVAPANNDFVAGDTYNIGGNVSATTDVDLTFTYLGHEAGYNNDFNAYGGTLNNKSNLVGDSFTVIDANGGLLDFDFFSNSISAGVANGSNNGFGAPQSFAVMLDYTFAGTFYDAVIFFDDSGAGPDDNHDDHIIGVNATANVPEPGTLVLLGLGLAGIGAARRRQA